MQNYIDIFIDNFIKGIPNLVTALGIFVVGIYLAKALSKILTRVLKVRKAPEGVTQLLAQLAYSVVIVFGVITALQRFFDVTAFLAGLGILGFTIGFALQDVMKNFAAGVILLIQQPFHVGETIGVKDYDGTVLEIDLRSTEIRAVDGRIVIIPNADILANPIVNYTRAIHRRVDLSLNLPHEAEPNIARQLVLDSVQSVIGFVKEPMPMVTFNNLTGSALEMTVNFWVDVTKNNPAEAKDSALLNVKSAFGREGIQIPHPVQKVLTQD
jgi:small conductance mechanosensitive channel